MAQTKEYKYTKNPNNTDFGEIDWSKFPLEELVKNVSKATEIPESEVQMLGRNDKSEDWNPYTTTMKGTAAMQTALGTPYTYDQAKKYVTETLGYELRMVAVAPGYEPGYVFEPAEEQKIDLNALFNGEKAKKLYAYMKPETMAIMKELVREYPHGTKGRVEEELFDRAVRMYAASIGKKV